jgi:hypothetical protein
MERLVDRAILGFNNFLLVLSGSERESVNRAPLKS